MNRLILIVALFACGLTLIPQITQAHPSVSVVIDRDGNVFYSDLTHVWMIKPDGSTQIAVRNVHTHQLWLGSDNSLYGEDVANVGDDYRHRIWRRLPDGEVVDERSWRDGFPGDYNDYSFNRDAFGNSFILDRETGTIVVHDGKQAVRRIRLDLALGFPHWLTATPDGTVYLTIGSTLQRIDPSTDKPESMAKGLVHRSPEFEFVHDRHALMGIWTGIDDSIFIADYAGQALRRVDQSGNVSTFWKAEGDWSVAGGTTTNDGTVYVLEWSESNQVRIRKIGLDGESRILGAARN